MAKKYWFASAGWGSKNYKSRKARDKAQQKFNKKYKVKTYKYSK